jgi:NAD(P)-dependent dehydrogenase (short-subunit alcohol dehydrogenase family)
MARVFITGSADGLGLMAAHLLVVGGHDVTLHARNEQRAADAAAQLPDVESTAVGDLSTIEGIRSVAAQVNAAGRYDAVIHNVGVGYREPRISTADGLEHVFAINVLAPYLLTAWMPPPERLVYLSSGMARGGSADLRDPQWTKRPWNGSQAYSDSKLFDMLLAFGVARRWPSVRSNTVEPGWVPTKMGGAGGPDDLSLAPITQAWLAVSDDPAARQSGEHFFHQQHSATPSTAHSAASQDALLDYCESITGVGITPAD